MQQHEINPARGSRKSAKRVGRGNASGHGTYSCRGCKGNKARAGFGVRPGFEGGQLPLIKRLPEKRGFNNRYRQEYNVVGLAALNTFESGSVVDSHALIKAGLIKNNKNPLKILAGEGLEHGLTVKANKFSVAARAAIEAAGGTAEEVAYAAEGG